MQQQQVSLMFNFSTVTPAQVRPELQSLLYSGYVHKMHNQLYQTLKWLKSETKWKKAILPVTNSKHHILPRL